MSNELLTPQTDRERALVAQTFEAEQRKRRKVQLALAVAVLLLVAAGGAFAWWRDKQAKERALIDEQTRVERSQADAEREYRAGRVRRHIRANLVLAAELRKQNQFSAASVVLYQVTEQMSDAPDLFPEVEQALRDHSLASKK